jgi:hypothetical protein
MATRISLIVVTVGAAVCLAAPAAQGDDWYADRLSGGGVHVSPDSADRAQALEQQRLWRMLDARERGQALSAQTGTSVPVRGERFVGDTHSSLVATSSPGSGREPDWSQLGIGFGVGLLVAFGLGLAAWVARIRPLAH